MNIKTTTALATGCLVAPLLTHALFAQQGQQGGDAPQRTTANNSQAETAPKLLDSLEGTWEVEVAVNPRQWGKHVGHDSKDGSGMRPDGRDPGQRDGGSATGRETGGAGQVADRPSGSQMDAAGQGKHMTVKGIALAESVLGGDILAMTSLMSKSDSMKGSSKDSGSDWSEGDKKNDDDKKKDDKQKKDDERKIDSSDRGKLVTDEPEGGSNSDDKAWKAPSDTANLMRSVSYFAFDSNTQQYSAVFMSDMDGAMHHATGKYDASSKRIVFHGSQSGADDSGSDARRPGAGSRGTIDASSPRSDSMDHEKGQHTAVLRMIDDKSFEVTMYLGGDVPGTSGSDAQNDRRDASDRNSGGNAARDRDARAGQGQPGSTGGQKDDGTGQKDEDWVNSKGEQKSLPANVLYRATYKRASGERARQCIDEMQKDEQRRRNG